MKKRKLNYIFHNPNPVDVTGDYILKVMMESNESKVERALENARKQQEQENGNREEHSA